MPRTSVTWAAVLFASLAAGCISIRSDRAASGGGSSPTGLPTLPAATSQVDNEALAREFAGQELWVTATDGPAVRDIQVTGSTFTNLARRVSPGVVNLYTTLVVPGRVQVNLDPLGILPGIPIPIERKGSALGTGFVIHPKGLILTNNHVVTGATEIKVVLVGGDGKSGGRELPAKIVGADAKTDIALLRVYASEPLPALALGDSDSLQIGEMVMAVGNPFGLSHTVTTGIVSQLGRVIGLGPYDDFIQIDASINPGNSGGPLLNLRGEVIGINTAIAPMGQGLGFSTPINKAKLVMPQLLRGEVVRAWIGVSTQAVDAALDRELGLGGHRGALIIGVGSGSPAERAGLRVKDLITGIDGTEVTDPRDLAFRIAEMRVGSTVRLTIRREGKELTVPVVLGRQP